MTHSGFHGHSNSYADPTHLDLSASISMHRAPTPASQLHPGRFSGAIIARLGGANKRKVAGERSEGQKVRGGITVAARPGREPAPQAPTIAQDGEGKGRTDPDSGFRPGIFRFLPAA
jgi:hypothetical protein